MTQGGKIHDGLAPRPLSAFAPLRQWLATDSREVEPAVKNLAIALANFEAEGKLAIEILEGEDVDHWTVSVGRRKPAIERGPKARGDARDRKAKADVRLVMRRETWIDIAQGRLNPFDAFAAGKLLVGGNTDVAKRIVRHLTDASVPFVSPC